MTKTFASALIAASLPLTAAHAGNLPAVNQTQPTSTVVTTTSASSAGQSALPNTNIKVVQAPEGSQEFFFEINFDLSISGTQTDFISAFLLPDGTVQITLPDGSQTVVGIPDFDISL